MMDNQSKFAADGDDRLHLGMKSTAPGQRFKSPNDSSPSVATTTLMPRFRTRSRPASLGAQIHRTAIISNARPRLIIVSLLTSAALLFGMQGVQAASYTFDPDQTLPLTTGTPTSAGDWDTTSNFWHNGSGYTTWGNQLTDEAIFNGGKTANLTQNINVGRITIPSSPGGSNIINLNGYTISLGAVGGNSFSISNGSLTTNGGTFDLKQSSTISSISGVNLGSAIKLNAYTLSTAGNTNGNTTLGGVVSGTGGITKGNGGFLAMGGANTFTGNVTVNAGQLRPGIASVANVSGAFGLNTNVILSGTGNINLRNGTGPWYNTQIGSLAGTGTTGVNLSRAVLTTGANNASTTFAGVISHGDGGSGSGLTKVGTGTFTLTGANTYNGPTLINGGKLLVNNTSGSGTGSGAVTVNSTGTLGGTGTIITGGANVTVNGGGKLSPGNSPGTLTLDLGAGTLDLSSISTGALQFELGPVNASDQIVLSSGTLGLGTLDFNEFAFSPFATLNVGDVFTLFQANSHTGGLGVTSGFFNNGVYGGELSLSGSNVLLTINFSSVPEPGTLALAALGLVALAWRFGRRQRVR